MFAIIEEIGYNFIQTAVLIAHKDARFMAQWLEGYRNYYGGCWYCNAGIYPTEHVIKKNPQLVRDMTDAFGANGNVRKYLYLENHSRAEWMAEYFTIHTLIRHRKDVVLSGTQVVMLNEDTIQCYNYTFGAMARLIQFGDTRLFNCSSN